MEIVYQAVRMAAKLIVIAAIQLRIVILEHLLVFFPAQQIQHMPQQARVHQRSPVKSHQGDQHVLQLSLHLLILAQSLLQNHLLSQLYTPAILPVRNQLLENHHLNQASRLRFLLQ